MDQNGAIQYRWPGHGGLLMSGNHWYQKLTGQGGNTLDFLMKYLGLSFTQAMQELVGFSVASTLTTSKSKAKELRMPEKAKNEHRVIAYLTKTRGLPAKLVVELIRTGLLYQDMAGNCVFVCRDAAGTNRGAILRGTFSDVVWRGSASGTNTTFPWWWPPASGSSDIVTVTESPIDAVSLSFIRPGCRDGHIISLGGVPHLQALYAFIEAQNIKRVVLALDNDQAGQNAVIKACDKLKKNGVKVWILKSSKKDWNEDL